MASCRYSLPFLDCQKLVFGDFQSMRQRDLNQQPHGNIALCGGVPYRVHEWRWNACGENLRLWFLSSFCIHHGFKIRKGFVFGNKNISKTLGGVVNV
jgi:hypothetical protein